MRCRARAVPMIYYDLLLSNSSYLLPLVPMAADAQSLFPLKLQCWITKLQSGLVNKLISFRHMSAVLFKTHPSPWLLRFVLREQPLLHNPPNRPLKTFAHSHASKNSPYHYEYPRTTLRRRLWRQGYLLPSTKAPPPFEC